DSQHGEQEEERVRPRLPVLCGEDHRHADEQPEQRVMTDVMEQWLHTRCSRVWFLSLPHGASGIWGDRSSSHQRTCTLRPRSTVRPATVTLLYDVLSCDVKCKPARPSL